MLRPYKDRFRKMLTDRDPGLRQVAAWALARTGDLDVVPGLIDALIDPDDDGGRRPRGRASSSSAARSTAWARPARRRPSSGRRPPRKWREWYERSARSTLEGQDDDGAGRDRRPTEAPSMSAAADRPPTATATEADAAADRSSPGPGRVAPTTGSPRS